jgi:hypothetical protein
MAGGGGRSLTVNALAEANKLSGAKSFQVLQIVRVGVGDLYLSDAARDLGGGITTTACVLSWGTIDQPGMRIGSQASAAMYPLANLTVKVSLADSTLRSTFLGSNPPIGSRCLLYQMWVGLDWTLDKVLVYDGALGAIGGGASQTFTDKEVAISLNIIDRFKTLLDREVGNRADVETFPHVFKEHEGRVIPLVYGRSQKTRAVMIDGPKIGRLMKDVQANTGTLYIEGGKEFPQGESLDVRIGQEIIQGPFNGNTFTATDRGHTYATFHSAGHQDADPLQIVLERNIPAGDSEFGYEDEYIGMFAGITVGDHWREDEILVYAEGNPGQIPAETAKPTSNGFKGRQWRKITGWDATGKILNIEFPFFRDGLLMQSPYGSMVSAGSQTWAFDGMEIVIGTVAEAHVEGEQVVELRTCTYALNNAPSKKLRALYFKGAKGKTMAAADFVKEEGWPSGGLIFQYPENIQFTGEVKVPPPNVNDYQAIPSSYFTLSLSDSAYSGALGHNITTILMHALPMYNKAWKVDGFDLWSDLDGVTDDNTPSGNLITNPADIIEDALVNRIGCDSGDIDPTSFSDSKTALAWCEFRGCVERMMRGQDLIAWLAMQARSRVRFEAGLIYMEYMSNAKAETPLVPTVSRGNAEMEGLQLTWEDPGQCVNEIEFKYKGFDGEIKTGTVKDADSIADYERKSTSIDCTLCSSQVHAKEAALFWLYQWSRPFSGGRVSGFTPFLPFIRGAGITVYEPNWALESVPAEITGIRQTQERIDVSFRTFNYPGCSGTCEAFCETGVESITAEPCADACETSCQSLSELTCDDRAENLNGCGGNVCQLGNQIIQQDPPPDWSGGVEEGCCQLSCQDGCVSDCMASCETSCMAESITDQCDTACITCETGCITLGCETVCQYGCMTIAEPQPPECLGCETSCRTICELSGQTCTSCQAACVDTATGCDISCEPVYIVNDCAASCIVTGCVSQCTVGGCETSCEVGETVDYECTLNCETSCRSSCELSDRDWTGA